MGIDKKETYKRIVSMNIIEEPKIETIPEEEENTSNNFNQHLSFKNSLRPFSSISDKFSNLDYALISSHKQNWNDEAYQLKVEIRDLTPEKSSESNIEVSTSGSYNILTKKKNKVFNFENFEGDFNYNNLKQTACFSPVMKCSEKNFMEREEDISVKKNENNLKIKNNSKNYISNGECHTLIKSPSTKSINRNISPKIKSEQEVGNKKRNSSYNHSSVLESMVSPRNFQENNKGSKLKNYREFHKHPSCDRVESTVVTYLPVITPPPSNRKKPNSIQNELKTIFNVAQNFQEDPEVKIKLDSLIKNIADIKTVLRMKSKNRSIISAPHCKKEIKNKIPSFENRK